MSKLKYIFVSGGVISGLGKGVTVAALAATIEARGYRVSPMKIDMYLNIDAGILNPKEHGEVFVTDDGMETDQDIGNYERFLGKSLSRSNYMTTGQVYKSVIDRERAFYYGGKTVEVIPHVTDEIINRIKSLGEEQAADIVIAELGGSVGEYQNDIFFEAARLFKLEYPENVLHIHVAYLPVPAHLGEMKTKPLQQSVRLLNERGIRPDFVIGRYDSGFAIDEQRRKKIALYCNVTFEEVISNPNADTIYKIPSIFEEQRFAEKVLYKLNLSPFKSVNMKPWNDLVNRIEQSGKNIKIGLAGKYFKVGSYVLSDVYISVIEALKHACWSYEGNPEIEWIDSEDIEKYGVAKYLKDLNGIVVPGGFGETKIDGIYEAIRYARENKIPYLGLCYGMQLSAIEFARNVCGLSDGDTTEINPLTINPIIHIMPEQDKKLLNKEYGGTMRLGKWNCLLKEGTLVHKAYGSDCISERHRHRYEFNNTYREILEKYGMIFSGTSTHGNIIEILELPEDKHPFFVGVQFHPEFKSRPIAPHPLFKAFIGKCLQ
ncbi:MAG TPA: CTP synthase [Candidatus Eremiobacteraeota bacterium]|nr:MAG: CTP synthase [bacterium ADurb.Bin363]HPZ08442.1 CTP synthase [Candidatus Eremiobacteraeota bacterium]